jgi:hypothetical protein
VTLLPLGAVVISSDPDSTSRQTRTIVLHSRMGLAARLGPIVQIASVPRSSGGFVHPGFVTGKDVRRRYASDNHVSQVVGTWASDELVC